MVKGNRVVKSKPRRKSVKASRVVKSKPRRKSVKASRVVKSKKKVRFAGRKRKTDDNNNEKTPIPTPRPTKKAKVKDENEDEEKKLDPDNFIEDLRSINVICIGDSCNTQQNSSLHTQNVIRVLKQYGFKEVHKPGKEESKDSDDSDDSDDSKEFKDYYGQINRNYKIYNLFENQEDGKYYMEQPNGSQAYPDFLLVNKKDNHIFVVPLELKLNSKETGSISILWNDGFPRDKCIYIFSKQNMKTQVFPGSFIKTQEDEVVYKKIKESLEAVKLQNKKSKRYSKKGCSSHPFNFNVRKAISQHICIDDLQKKSQEINDKLKDILKDIFN